MTTSSGTMRALLVGFIAVAASVYFLLDDGARDIPAFVVDAVDDTTRLEPVERVPFLAGEPTATPTHAPLAVTVEPTPLELGATSLASEIAPLDPEGALPTRFNVRVLQPGAVPLEGARVELISNGVSRRLLASGRSDVNGRVVLMLRPTETERATRERHSAMAFVSADGFSTRLLDAPWRAGATGGLGYVLLKPGVRVRGRVVDSTGRAVSGAELSLGRSVGEEVSVSELVLLSSAASRAGVSPHVSWLAIENATTFARSGPDGAWEMFAPPGDFAIAFSIPGHTHFVERLSVPPGGRDGVELTLKMSAVFGHVVDEEGNAIHAARVLMSAQQRAVTTLTGAFEFPHVDDDEDRLTVLHADFLTEEVDLLSARRGLRVVLSRGARLTVRVTRSDGRPVDHAPIDVMLERIATHDELVGRREVVGTDVSFEVLRPGEYRATLAYTKPRMFIGGRWHAPLHHPSAEESWIQQKSFTISDTSPVEIVLEVP